MQGFNHRLTILCLCGVLCLCNGRIALQTAKFGALKPMKMKNPQNHCHRLFEYRFREPQITEINAEKQS